MLETSRSMLKLATLTLLALIPVAGADLKALYEAHRWSELAAAVQTDKKAPPIYRAVVASVFNDNNRAERLLRSILRSSPAPDVLPIAYEALVHIYMRTGRYRSLNETVKAARVAIPSVGWPELAAFEGLPDQLTGRSRHSTLNPEPGEIFIPATINNQAVTYFLDTGAWLNSVSESEARRLGMRFEASSASANTSTGAAVTMRMAVAADVAIAGIHYRNVSFAVLPDDQEPWSLLMEGRRGLLGISLIQGFQTLRWRPNGTMEIGFRPRRLDRSMANLYFDDDHLIVASDTNGERVLATVDTGAVTTDLYENFAKRFPKLVSETGVRDHQEIRGVGNAQTFDSVTIPRLWFALGGADVVLEPAHVILKPIGNQRCVGNFGMDLFKQGRYFEIDLRAMRLELSSRKPHQPLVD